MNDWDRLQRYMTLTGCGWRGLADALGYTQTSLSRVKKTGKASKKLLKALELAEEQAGIANKSEQSEKGNSPAKCATVAPFVNQDEKQGLQNMQQLHICPPPTTGSVREDRPGYGADASPPACDSARLAALEDAIRQLASTTAAQGEALQKQSETINDMMKLLVRLLAEQESPEGERSDGIAG